MRRRQLGNGNLIFTCNGCDKLNHYLSAVVGIEDEESDKYKIIRAPSTNDHLCWETGNKHIIKSARDEMCAMVVARKKWIPTQSFCSSKISQLS